MRGTASSLLALLLAAAVAPSSVRSCSCPESAFSVSRTDAIRGEFASSYRPNIYIGMVVAATCNCIPGNEASPTGVTSSSLNCQQYTLQTAQSIINATLLSRGQCDLEEYRTEDYPSLLVCSLLGNTLVTWGLTVEGPVPPSVGEEQPIDDLTQGNGCRYACPFNDNSDLPQPCQYTIRVGEVFKGNYTENQEIEVPGPDVLTSCGNPELRLQISSQYVVGVGGACSPIGEWTVLSSYRPSELKLFRELSNSQTVGGWAVIVSGSTSVMVLLSLLAFWLSPIPPP